MDRIGAKTLEVMSRAKYYNSWLFEHIRPYLGGQILEIGSGSGNFSRLLARAGTLTGIDYSPDYIQMLTKLQVPGAKFGVGDIEKGKYFFGTKMFDALVCMNVLEHINDDRQALRNMSKLLKPGGKLFLLVPAHQFAYSSLDTNLGHYRRYTANSLTTKLKAAGFTVQKSYYLNLLGLAGWWLNGKLLKRQVLPGKQLAVFDWLARPFLFVENYVTPPFGLSVVAIAIK